MSASPFVAISIPDGWSWATIASVTSKVGSGATPRGGSSVYVEEGPAFIRSQNVYDHEFAKDGLVRLTAEAAHALRGVTVEADDVLLNITGDSILRTCVVPQDVLPARVSQHVAIVRSNGAIDPGFLQKWLALPIVKDYMLGHSSGGTRKAVTKGHILSFPVPVPPIDEQRAISATLGAFDAKIESARRVIDKSESLADAVFAASSGSHVELGSVARLIMGSSPPGTSYNEDGIGTPFYQGVRDFGRRYPSHRVWTTEPGRLAQDDDTLLSVRAPVGTLNRAWESCCLGRGVAAIHSNTPSTAYYALRAARAVWEPFQQEGTVFGAINKTDLAKASVPWPSGPALVTIETKLAALDSRIRTSCFEMRRLVALRDALAPQLTTGGLRLSEFKDRVEATA